MAEDRFRIQTSDRKRRRWTEWLENRGWNNRRSRRKLFGGW